MKRAIAVTIAGQRFSLKSDADEAYVQLLADFVDEKIRELAAPAQRAGAHEVALLAALRIADDLFRERRQRADLRRRVRERVERMLGEVAQAAGTEAEPEAAPRGAIDDGAVVAAREAQADGSDRVA